MVVCKSDVKNNSLELDDIEIAFANGIKGLNKENQEILREIMEDLLKKQNKN